MPKLPHQSDANFEQPPPGLWLAVCYAVLELGHQIINYGRGEQNVHQIALLWELVGTQMADGRPYVCHRKYTYSSSAKSNLIKDLESWRGQKFTPEQFGQFELANVIGVPCQLNLVQNEKGYVDIAGIMPAPPGTAKPVPVNPIVVIDLQADLFNQSAFDSLTDYWRGLISRSPEYIAICNPHGGIQTQAAQPAVGGPGSQTAAPVTQPVQQQLPQQQPQQPQPVQQQLPQQQPAPIPNGQPMNLPGTPQLNPDAPDAGEIPF